MSDQVHSEELPPAYFLSLRLENVRCFGPEQTLDLTDEEGNPAQWTVLLGDNGTGKTTLLQAIAGMHTTHSLTFERGEEEQEQVEPLITAGNPPFSEWRKRVGRSGYWQMKVKVGFSDEVESEKEYFTTLEIGAGHSMFIPEEAGIKCIAYGASRRMGEDKFETTDYSSVAGIFSDEEGGIADAEKWLRELDYAAKSGEARAERRRDRVEEILADPETGVLPDVDGVRFSSRKDEFSGPRVEFHTHYGWVTLRQLSLGYRTMIAWVVDLARRLFKRYPDSENPLAEPAVCLVDEIDLHLHPKWQRKIIDFLSDRFPNTQFIVTAHSPLVVQAAHDANIALLKRVEVDDGDDYVQIHNDMEPVGNLRVDQILTSDLYGLESARPPDLDELLEERRDILAKSELTDEDEARLDEIEERVGDVPAGETKEQREAMAFIKDVADRLDEDE
jgi:ABC-type multidrug transport system ATPase subunit